MTHPQILGQLSSLHEMMVDLLGQIPPQETQVRFHPELASLAWYLGHSVYRELYWLREVLTGDADLTARVRHLFEPGDWDAQCTQLPPPDHLLRWSAEIWSEDLRRLATSGALPEDPRLEEDRLQWFLLQETAGDYEAMLRVLLARRIASAPEDYRVSEPLRPQLPEPQTLAISQGHYRIGSRYEPFAYDNELPPQAVPLSNFRIARHPVSNGEYLAFMEAGGYEESSYWEAEGWAWLQTQPQRVPWQWRRDARGYWYELGINGPMDLVAQAPVSGLNYHEARAYAAWVASLGGARSGAVLQHEYQWEVAARGGELQGTGRVLEWCSNVFHPYPDFAPFPDARVSQEAFEKGTMSLRGASLHTQRCRRRASHRRFAPPEQRTLIAGMRLVFPPDQGE